MFKQMRLFLYSSATFSGRINLLFTNLYMPRTLAHIAHIYAGSETLKEQAVNSDPYLFKLAIDGLKEGDIAPNHEVREDAEGILNNDEI